MNERNCESAFITQPNLIALCIDKDLEILSFNATFKTRFVDSSSLSKQRHKFPSYLYRNQPAFINWIVNQDDAPISVYLLSKHLPIPVLLFQQSSYADVKLLIGVITENLPLVSEQERLLNGAFNLTNQGIGFCDKHRRLISFNDAFKEILDSQEDDLKGYIFPEMGTEDREIKKSFTNAMEQGQIFEYAFVIDHPPKPVRRVLVRMMLNETASEDSKYYACMVADCTNEHKRLEMLESRAARDELTGLNNRYGFFEKFTKEAEHATRDGLILTLFYLDIDGFKYFNDTYGHEFGDEILKTFSNILNENLRSDDVVGRLGGDEFCILFINSPEKPLNVKLVAQKLLDTISKPVLICEQLLRLSSSLGVAQYPLDTVDIDVLVKMADKAMYQAKNSGKGKFVISTSKFVETTETD